MREKKYDVYSGNEKIGEVWGKSSEETASEILSAIDEKIDRDERRTLAKTDRVLAQLGDKNAMAREAVRAASSNAVAMEMRWKKIFFIMLIISAISVISAIGSGGGLYFMLPEGKSLSEHIIEVLVMRAVSIYSLIDIILMVGHVILKKKFYFTDVCTVFGKDITGKSLSKAAWVILWLCLYVQFNLFAIFMFTVYAFIKWKTCKFKTDDAIKEHVKMEDRTLGKW